MIEVPQSTRGHIAADLMPDLTPLLDVMFMLIVFFILTANAVPYALDVDLPEDKKNITQAVENPDIVHITLMADGITRKVNDVAYTDTSAFEAALSEKAQDNKRVIIIGDKDVSMETLLSVMVFLRQQQIDTADIIMDRQ